MGFFRNINCIRKVICDIRWDMTVIRDQLKIINKTIIDKPEDSDRVKLLEEQVDCLIKNNFKDGKAYDSIVLIPSKKMSDMGQMPMIIHRGEKINTDNMTSFNLSWSYGDGAILTTEKESCYGYYMCEWAI